jgi:hypothetical protein
MTTKFFPLLQLLVLSLGFVPLSLRIPSLSSHSGSNTTVDTYPKQVMRRIRGEGDCKEDRGGTNLC